MRDALGAQLALLSAGHLGDAVAVVVDVVVVEDLESVYKRKRVLVLLWCEVKGTEIVRAR
jgi:hypothetical protein